MKVKLKLAVHEGQAEARGTLYRKLKLAVHEGQAKARDTMFSPEKNLAIETSCLQYNL